MFVTGHTHAAYNCVIDGRPVTSASSNGRLVTDLELHARAARRTSRRSARTTCRSSPRAARRRPTCRRSSTATTRCRRRCGGRRSAGSRADITRNPDTDGSGENAAGNLIADAQLADTDDADRGNAVGALMNPGGVRSDFVFAQSGTEGDGVVTYEEAFTVQPFNNIVATQTFTGAQVLDVLKDQWCGTNTSQTVLLPSSSIHYTFSKVGGREHPRQAVRRRARTRSAA